MLIGKDFEEEFVKLVSKFRTVESCKFFSNELLWKAAHYDKKIIYILYERVKKLWLKKVPVDSTGFLSYDDWVQIAAEIFLVSWSSYKPELGYRFSTFILTAVNNGWRNELTKLNSISRKTNRESIPFSKFNDISNLIISEFLNYDDDISFKYFVNRFETYLIRNQVNSAVLNVLKIRLFDSRYSISIISKLLKIRENVVKNCLKSLNDYIIEFIKLERGVYESCV